jgi:hypothetical protein
VTTPADDRIMQTIIVGVDQSDTARRAAFAAAKIAAACCSPLHVVMAVNRGKSVELTVGASDRWHLDWLSSAEQFLDALVGELPASPITSRQFARPGDSALRGGRAARGEHDRGGQSPCKEQPGCSVRSPPTSPAGPRAMC